MHSTFFQESKKRVQAHLLGPCQLDWTEILTKYIKGKRSHKITNANCSPVEDTPVCFLTLTLYSGLSPETPAFKKLRFGDLMDFLDIAN